MSTEFDWPTPGAREVFSQTGAVTEHALRQYIPPRDLQFLIDRSLLSRDWHAVGDESVSVITPADGRYGLIPEANFTALQAAVSWSAFDHLRTRTARLLWLANHAVVLLGPGGRAVVHALRLGNPTWWNLPELHYDVFHTGTARFPGHDVPHRIVVHTDAPHHPVLPGMIVRPVNVAALLRRGGDL